MKFTEAQLEKAFTELLGKQGIPHTHGDSLERQPEDVLLRGDMVQYLLTRYAEEGITENEINSIIADLERLPASDLYESNKTVMHRIREGIKLTREDRTQKDIYIDLIDYSDIGQYRRAADEELTNVLADPGATAYSGDRNIYRVVTQLKVQGSELRIPDAIIYINGLPVVVVEFKSAVREEATVHDAYVQLTTRYKRAIPELFKYNAFCIISDGANTRAGSFFAEYDYYYGWRRVAGQAEDVDGINALYTLIEGMLDRKRLRDILHNFIFLPDKSKKNEKVVCRYPQYYAANKLFDHIRAHQRPKGDGKGGTYFGATGCGKSYTMLYLTRLLMKSVHFESPSIVLITDRNDLDEQLSTQFVNAKQFIGDNTVVNVESREKLRELLQGRRSGGVFLTTIHMFTEAAGLLTDRTNVICISDEAHRSQLNLDQKVKVTTKRVEKKYGFAKYLHYSLPNATYVGFTGTPIDGTYDVFGKVVDAYTMVESVKDEITVPIVYEGRAAKVLLNNAKLQEIEAYYNRCAEEGSNEQQIEDSKKAMAQMNAIIGDPGRLKDVARDFVAHYEARIIEGATIRGKAMFVASSREIAYELYKNILELRPQWGEALVAEDGAVLTEKEQKEIKPMPRIKMVATRGADDNEALYDMLGTSEYRKELARQFKFDKSNFKIALVVDMWLTGFDVPALDTMYIDKPVQRHNLIQTISRVNRKSDGKQKGLVVDYIGIKKQMNMALALFNQVNDKNVEDIQQSVVVVKDQLDLLGRLMHQFDAGDYYRGSAVQQLHTLNMAAEFVQLTKEQERRFMYLTRRLKAAYDVCVGSEELTQQHRDEIHFYLAVRSILAKLTKGDAPDTAQMNARVKVMIEEALRSEGVEEIMKLGEDTAAEVNLFDPQYLEKIEKIKLPNTKIKLLQQLLAKAIDEVRQVNRMVGIDFSQRMQAIVDRYNERDETSVLRGEVLEDFTDEIIDLYYALVKERESFKDLGIDFEEKAFYDILKALAVKYDFTYPEDKLLVLARKVKVVVDDKARYTDWSKRDDIKAELKADLVILLAENDYPPVDRDEVYKEIFTQAENFKKYSSKVG